MAGRKLNRHQSQYSLREYMDILSLQETDKKSKKKSADFVTHDDILEALFAKLNDPQNSCCADCGSPEPTWAVINVGCFICTACSGVHRSLGTHISAVRSVKLDKWSDSQIGGMRGNNAVNDELEFHVGSAALKPGPHSSRAVREAFIRSKYSSKEFVARDGCPRLAAEVDPAGATAAPAGGAAGAADAPATTRAATAGMILYEGLLIIRVIEGIGLKQADLLSPSDPYVVFANAAGQTVKTKTIDDDNDPKWNETVQISVLSFDSAIHIEVFDEDRFSKDDLIGVTSLDLAPFEAKWQANATEEIPVLLPLQKQGKLRLALSFHSLKS